MLLTRSSLLTLPTELLTLIGCELSDDSANLDAFARVSKRAYEIINPILYEQINQPIALPTLALPNAERISTLSSQHPAAFVESIKLDFRDPKNPNTYDATTSSLLKGDFQKAFLNLIEYGRMGKEGNRPALTTIALDCDVPFLELFRDIDLGLFSFKEAILRCKPPPNKNQDVERYCRFLSQMLKDSVEYLILDNAISDNPPLSSSHSTTIVRQISYSASNLHDLYWYIPRPPNGESDSSIVSNLNHAFNEVFFPTLLSFSVTISWSFVDSIHLPNIDVAPFLRRHPKLDFLSCRISDGHRMIQGPLGRYDLPKLKLLNVGPVDFLTLLAENPTWGIRELYLPLARIWPGWEQHIVGPLEGISKTLENLTLEAHMEMVHEVTSPRWLDLAFPIGIYEHIFKACTNLTRLTCPVNLETLQGGFIPLIAKNLPRLKSLLLTFVDSRPRCSFEDVKQTVAEGVHKSLLNACSTLPSDLVINCYYHSELGLKSSAQISIENGMLRHRRSMKFKRRETWVHDK